MADLVPEPHLLAAYVLGVLIVSLTPGPDMTFFVGRTIANGVPHGLAALTGATTGVLVHSMLAAFGLSALIVASPGLFLAIKIMGALYLLWLAIEALRTGSSFRFGSKDARKTSLARTWMQGVLIDLLNPKIILFFMTFLPQFVSVSDPNAREQLLFLGVLFVLLSYCTMVPVILLAARLTGWLKANPRVTRVIDYVFASVFGAFAIRILLTERS